MKKLPLEYRITLKDMDSGWKLMGKYFADEKVTEDEMYLADLLVDAPYIYQKTGKRPTVAEVHAHWKQEAHEREQKRINSWRDAYQLTAKDFTTLADSDSGPMFIFVEAAESLKTSTGQYPTIAEVRAEVAKRKP
jgi:hypothetical protein